ncbi:MAG: TonB-dependent receptor [Gillisia sp.]
MQKIFLLLFAMALAIPSYSQNTIKGKVTDADTQKGLMAATLYIPSIQKGTTTDFDGNFELDHLRAGKYKLVISSIGYTSKTLDITVPSETTFSIILKPSAIEMEEVIVSTPFHQLQSENVMKVARESVNELQQKGAVTLADGITNLPGVESVTTGAGIGKPVIRGLSSNRVLVYTQGVRLENQQFGGEHGLGVSSSGVESVEVIKGPASLLYGSDALGGVLYLNPEKYAEADSTHLDAKYTYLSNTLGSEINAGAKTSGKNLKFLVRGNYATHSDYKTGNEERVTDTRFDELDLKTGVGYRKGSYKGDLRYNFNHSVLGIPDSIGVQSTSKNKILPYQKVDNHVLSLDNNIYFGNSSLELKVGYLFNNRKEFSHESVQPDGSLTPGLELHLNTLNYDVKYNTPNWGKLETIIGLQGMHQTNTNFGEELLIPDATVNDVGVLATSHYDFEKVNFQAGIRIDNRKINSKAMGMEGSAKYFAPVSRSFTSFNGAFGIKYDPFSNFTSRLNLATGFRAPNLAELTSNGIHEGTNRYEIGNTDLSNEQNFQIDLALEYKSRHFDVYVNPFFNKINNYIYIGPNGEYRQGNPVYVYSQTNADLYGGEAGIHLHPHPWDWLHLESSIETVYGEKQNGDPLPLIPAVSVTNTMRTEFGESDKFTSSYAFLSLKSTFAQDRVSAFENPSSGYSLLSAGLGSSFRLDRLSFELNISGNNLLNKSYISHLSRLKPAGIENMGRNISISLHASI